MPHGAAASAIPEEKKFTQKPMQQLKDITALAVQAATTEPLTIQASIANHDWKFTVAHPEQAKALEAAQRFCAAYLAERDCVKAANAAAREAYFSDSAAARERGERMPDEPKKVRATHRWLSLLGPSGRGKTHLAERIKLWRDTCGGAAFFYKWIDLVDRFRADHDAIARFAARCDETAIMVIDDIGSGHETAFANSILATIAERRLGRPTVWTSNLSLEGIAQIDARIASRMRRNGSEIFTFKATPDFNSPR